MLPNFPVSASHPSGEEVFASEVTPPEVVTVQTPSGPVTVSWEPGTAVSVHGLAVFLIEFCTYLVCGRRCVIVVRCSARVRMSQITARQINCIMAALSALTNRIKTAITKTATQLGASNTWNDFIAATFAPLIVARTGPPPLE